MAFFSKSHACAILFIRYSVTTQVVRFTVGFFIFLLVYIHRFITLNLGTVNLKSCLVSVSSAHSPSQILASLSDGTLSESIRVPVVRP